MTKGWITVTIEAEGYHSRIEIPVDAPNKAQAFCDWFRMQLDYFARWEPGSSALLREWQPVAKKP